MSLEEKEHLNFLARIIWPHVNSELKPRIPCSSCSGHILWGLAKLMPLCGMSFPHHLHTNSCFSFRTHSSDTSSGKWQCLPPLTDLTLCYSHSAYRMPLLSSCLAWTFTFLGFWWMFLCLPRLWAPWGQGLGPGVFCSLILVFSPLLPSIQHSSWITLRYRYYSKWIYD